MYSIIRESMNIKDNIIRYGIEKNRRKDEDIKINRLNKGIIE